MSLAPFSPGDIFTFIFATLVILLWCYIIYFVITLFFRTRHQPRLPGQSDFEFNTFQLREAIAVPEPAHLV